MKTRKHQPFNGFLTLFVISAAFSLITLFGVSAAAQDATAPSRFRVGEKLSYNVSFGKFTDAAYVEMSVVSNGRLDGRDVVELRSKLKMLGIVSAAFFQFDESRTVFVAPDTGLPLYSSKLINSGIEPKETVVNNLKEPALSFDLLSILYKAREANGLGSFPLSENGRFYTVTFQPTETERVKTEAGEFDTQVSVVQSDYLTENGVKEMKINFAADASRVPVLIRIKLPKGVFKAELADILMPKPVAENTPTQIQTPSAPATPKVVVTPPAYVENQPLTSELGFLLGETLDYRISNEGKPLAIISLAAKERKLFQNDDSLHLTATVTRIEAGNGFFVPGDSVNAQVDPETLAPFWVETRFAGAMKKFNQTSVFDRKSGSIMFGGEKAVDAPIGTHTFLSMIYAMRSFNLKPSKDSKSPVNDTRVAVFWDVQPYVFVLQPSNSEVITVNGEKTEAQMIAIATGIDTIDKQGLKIWLAAENRMPVRFALGSFQAELVSTSNSLSK